MILVTYMFIASIHWPTYIATKLENGVCKMEFLHQTDRWMLFQFWYGLCILFIFYFIPSTLFVILYGLVIRAFYIRKRQSQLAQSRVIDKAAEELTKTAFTVTVIFIITMGYGIWHFLLGTVGVLPYTVNSLFQMIGLWLSCLNSAVNPFVYALLMPAYRKSVLKTFYCPNQDINSKHQHLPPVQENK